MPLFRRSRSPYSGESHSVHVRASAPKARQFETSLNGYDAAFFLAKDVPICLEWKSARAIEFDDLRRGLERALDRVPIVAGRVVVRGRDLQVSTTGSAGCLLQYERLNCNAPDLTSSRGAWRRYGVPQPLVPAYITEPFGRPLLSARLARFSDGCLLFITFSHAIFDGWSCTRFLEIWSWETARAAARDPVAELPAENPEDPDCRHRRFAPADALQEPASSSRLTLWGALQLASLFPLRDVIDREAEIAFTRAEWEALTARVRGGLDGERRISSFEALVAHLAEGIVKIAPGAGEFHGQVITNLRGRSPLVAPNHFGVAIPANMFRMERDAPVQHKAWQLHETLRQGLAERSALEAQVVVPDTHGAGLSGRFGMLRRVRNLGVFRDALLMRKPLFNSWVNFDWRKVSFGCGTRANRLHVARSFSAPGMFFVYQTADDIFILRFKLPRAQLNRFFDTLPFSAARRRPV